MMIKLLSLLIGLCILVFPQSETLSGADVLLTDKIEVVKNRNLGIVTNHSALLKNGVHLVDALSEIEGVNIIALYGPEHGIRGDVSAGEKIDNLTDEKTGIPVFSLYGKSLKPTAEMLKNVDMLIFDIQDVGARFYTYISTMYYIIEAGAEHGIEVVIIDRPNPIGGIKIEGPILELKNKSFVGIAPLPVTQAMTVGELANYFVGERLVKNYDKVKLTVIPIKNWKRENYFDATQLPWVKPSPNIPNLEAALVYPGTCIFEATNISEGRGTFEPFEAIGAPFINSEKLIEELKNYNLSGVEFTSIEFVPDSIPNMVNSPKHRGKKCNGVRIKITDRELLEPVKVGYALLYAINKLFPETEIKENSLKRLSGRDEIYTLFKEKAEWEKIEKLINHEVDNFREIRKKYLIY